MYLEFISGPKQGERFTLPESTVTVGREAPCDVVLDDEKMSRLHARISFEVAAFFVEDCDSTNGVLLNGVKLMGRQPLGDGDHLGFGDSECVCRADHQAAALASADTGTFVQTAAAPQAKNAMATPPAMPAAGVLERDATGARYGAGSPYADASARRNAADYGGDEEEPVAVPRALVHPAVLVAILVLVSVATMYILLPHGGSTAASTSGGETEQTDGSADATDGSEYGYETDDATGSWSVGAGSETDTELDDSMDDVAVDATKDVGVGDGTAPADGTDPFAVADPQTVVAGTGTGSSTGSSPDLAPMPPPTRAPEIPVAKAKLLWLTTTPPGAEVLLEGTARGHTPLLLDDLPDGHYAVTFRLPGYQPLIRTYDVPNAGTQQTATLRQANGTVLVTSEPAGAAIMYGSEVLGYTPTILSDSKASGKQDVKLVLPYHSVEPATLTFASIAPSTSHTVLKPQIGAIIVTATPAAATVYIDDFAKDRPTGQVDARGRSVATRFNGLRAGEHTLYLQVRGVKSEPMEVTVEANATLTVHLQMWLPDYTYTLKDGRKLVAMDLGTFPGDVRRVMLSDERLVSLPLAEITNAVELPLARAVALRDEAVAERRKAEMRRRLEEMRKDAPGEF